MALIGRDSGTRCSEIFGIEAETVALDFDLACSYRLLQFENKREYERLKAQKTMMRLAVIEAVSVAFGGQPLPDDNDDESTEVDDDDLV